MIAFILMIYGGLAWGWGDFEIAGTMLVLGIVAGWTNKSSINNTAKVYATGVKNLTNTYLIMGLASAVATILKSAGNVETIIYGLSQGLSNVPLWIIPVFMFIIVCIINIFVPSGTGKIPMLMPILGPVARHVGMSQQMVTYCYAFGDSIANYLLPYQSALAGFLESGRIPFARYMKFMWKLLVIWFVLAAAQLIIFQQCNIGPF